MGREVSPPSAVKSAEKEPIPAHSRLKLPSGVKRLSRLLSTIGRIVLNNFSEAATPLVARQGDQRVP